MCGGRHAAPQFRAPTPHRSCPCCRARRSRPGPAAAVRKGCAAHCQRALQVSQLMHWPVLVLEEVDRTGSLNSCWHQLQPPPPCMPRQDGLRKSALALTATGCTPCSSALNTVPNPPAPSRHSEPSGRFMIWISAAEEVCVSLMRRDSTRGALNDNGASGLHGAAPHPSAPFNPRMHRYKRRASPDRKFSKA